MSIPVELVKRIVYLIKQDMVLKMETAERRVRVETALELSTMMFSYHYDSVHTAVCDYLNCYSYSYENETELANDIVNYLEDLVPRLGFPAESVQYIFDEYCTSPEAKLAFAETWTRMHDGCTVKLDATKCNLEDPGLHTFALSMEIYYLRNKKIVS